MSSLDRILGRLRPKLILAFSFHLLTAYFLMQTGMAEFWAFSYGTGLAFAIGWVIMTTIAWQWKAFGDPRKPFTFVGHIVMFGNISLLLCRLTTKVDDGKWNLIDKVSEGVNSAFNLLGIFPHSLFKVLATPGIMAIFVLVMLAMSLKRRKWAVGIVITSILVFAQIEVSRSDFGNRLTLSAGILCFALALFLQFSDFARRDFWTKVTQALRDDPAPKGDLELKYRILSRILERTGSLSESQFRALVARGTGKNGKSPDVEAISRHIVDELVHADDLAEIVLSPSGQLLLVLDPKLFQEDRDAFWAIATVPKLAFTAIVCILWIISPIDVLPDAWPVVGTLDDAFVSIVAAFAASSALGSNPPHHRLQDGAPVGSIFDVSRRIRTPTGNRAAHG